MDAGGVETVGGSAGPQRAEVIGADFSDWPAELREEFAANGRNYTVGSRLLSQTDRVKVWEIRLAPGERLPAHCHVLDYFWTVLTEGVSVQHSEDGVTRRVFYRPGDTRHMAFGAGQRMLHDLNNAGASELIFITVEHLRAPDDPGPRQV
jgi:uncharacterized cupin superfamily protein